MLTAIDLHAGVARIAAGIAPLRDALNAADRALGDGDTGMTIEAVVAAWQAVTPVDPPDAGATLLALGKATSRASGSSLASVLSIGLSGAGRAVRGHDVLDRATLVTALAAARDAIGSRSGASVGDKSVLDSIAALEQAFDHAADADDLRAVALGAATAALEDFRPRESRIGRARMYGNRSAGSDDPGMLAAVLLLSAALG